jgi:hypothetical protein
MSRYGWPQTNQELRPLNDWRVTVSVAMVQDQAAFRPDFQVIQYRDFLNEKLMQFVYNPDLCQSPSLPCIS